MFCVVRDQSVCGASGARGGGTCGPGFRARDSGQTGHEQYARGPARPTLHGRVRVVALPHLLCTRHNFDDRRHRPDDAAPSCCAVHVSDLGHFRCARGSSGAGLRARAEGPAAAASARSERGVSGRARNRRGGASAARRRRAGTRRSVAGASESSTCAHRSRRGVGVARRAAGAKAATRCDEASCQWACELADVRPGRSGGGGRSQRGRLRRLQTQRSRRFARLARLRRRRKRPD